MKVNQLIFSLQKMPGDADVVVEYNISGGGYTPATEVEIIELEGKKVVNIASEP